MSRIGFRILGARSNLGSEGVARTNFDLGPLLEGFWVDRRLREGGGLGSAPQTTVILGVDFDVQLRERWRGTSGTR